MKAINYSIFERFGSVPATVKSALEAGQEIREYLQPDSLTVVDFEAVRGTDVAFLDVFLVGVQVALRERKNENVKTVLGNMDADIQFGYKTLFPVLGINDMAHIQAGKVDLLSGTNLLIETFKSAQVLTEARGSFTTPLLAEVLDTDKTAINKRLEVLVGSGAVGRKRQNGGRSGHRYAYEAVNSTSLG